MLSIMGIRSASFVAASIGLCRSRPGLVHVAAVVLELCAGWPGPGGCSPLGVVRDAFLAPGFTLTRLRMSLNRIPAIIVPEKR